LVDGRSGRHYVLGQSVAVATDTAVLGQLAAVATDTAVPKTGRYCR
jgi:hypothetical protein